MTDISMTDAEVFEAVKHHAKALYLIARHRGAKISIFAYPKQTDDERDFLDVSFGEMTYRESEGDNET